MAVSWASLMELLLPGGTAHFSDGIGSPGAGKGKTYTLRKAHEEWEKRDFTIFCHTQQNSEASSREVLYLIFYFLFCAKYYYPCNRLINYT